MKTKRNLYQTVLTIVVLLLSVVAFGQDNGDENPFTNKKFITIRGDVNKSNPVEGVNLEQADQGNLNQTNSYQGSDGRLESNIEKSNDVPERKRQQLEESHEFAAKNLYNYPNPFADQTTVSYEVGSRGMVNLTIYYKRMLVTVLIDSRLEAGTYSAVFAGKNLPAGTYTAVLTVNGDVATKSLFKVK